MVGLGLAFLGL